jgi:anti-sigma B factor antagonist
VPGARIVVPQEFIIEEEYRVSIQVTNRVVGDVSVVDVAGRITLGEGASALRENIRGLVGKGNKKILLNLSDVSYIDSSGIGELVSGFTTVTNQGGVLKLLGLTKRVKDLLQITKLYTVFEVFDDEAAAVRSFA